MKRNYPMQMYRRSPGLAGGRRRGVERVKKQKHTALWPAAITEAITRNYESLAAARY